MFLELVAFLIKEDYYMATYAVFESTNMKTTHYAERIFDAVATVDIENGTFGYIEELATDSDVIYKFVKGTKAGMPVVVVDQPVWTEKTCLTSNQRKDKFIITAGTPFRVRVVAKNDEFAISAAAVTSTSVDKLDVDAYLTIDTTGKLVASNTSSASATFEAKVMRKRISGGTMVTTAHNYGYSRTMYEAKITKLA